jgi:multicomponent Na+:H+ antiporter subunit E
LRRLILILLLGVILAVLWIVLSGKFDKVILNSMGGISVVLVLILSIRLRVIDTEATPYPRILALLRYWFWLGFEVGKSNLAVARLILQPDLKLTPRLVRVPATQKTPLGLTLFANSITLTPGTVSVALEDGAILVHAVDAQFVDLKAFEEMGRRARNAGEGAPW